MMRFRKQQPLKSVGFSKRYTPYYLIGIIFLAITIATGVVFKRPKRSIASSTTKAVRCYTCNNYASMGSGLRPGAGTGLSWFGGKPVVGGWSKASSSDLASDLARGLTAVQISRLCTEKVNRSAIPRLIDSDEYGVCPNVNFNGCAKLVTKSYRVKPQVGRPLLAAVVVTRSCAMIPEGLGVGCFQSVGGAGLRRTVCYCQGDFCNGAESRNKHSVILRILSIFVIVGLREL